MTKNYLSVGVEGVLACLMQRLVWSLLLICTYHWQKPPVTKVPLNVQGSFYILFTFSMLHTWANCVKITCCLIFDSNQCLIMCCSIQTHQIYALRSSQPHFHSRLLFENIQHMHVLKICLT